jgi:pantoate--beta-alanine ligase
MSAPQVIRSPAEMAAWSRAISAHRDRIAFVPTMGALHAGHAALMREGRGRGNQLVLSIFVNPTQFGPTEDLARYPRTLDADLALAASVGVDVVYVPDAAAVYPPGFQTYVDVRDLTRGLCGPFRPDHFTGVATVVAKLFNVVRPDVALFGEKDYQQLAVIRRMVTDLDMAIEIVGVPTVREPDGLALSSRNAYLGPSERTRARSLSRALLSARNQAATGVHDGHILVAQARALLDVDRLDYLELVDAETLVPVTHIDRTAVMAVAAFIGRTRLIDNVRIPGRLA